MTAGNGSQSKDAIILALPATEKVNLLAQALLREFLHRRGFKRTLGIFDQECPRHDKTISSRQLMNDMMKLAKIQGRGSATAAKRLAATAHQDDDASSTSTSDKKNKKAAAAAAKPPPAATFMELLCGYRIRKYHIRSHQRRRGDGGGGPGGSNTDAAADVDSDSSDEEAALRVAAEKHTALLRSSSAATPAAMSQEVMEKKASLLTELNALRAKEEKFVKKNKKMSAGAIGGAGGGKKKKNTKSTANEDGDFSPQRSRGRHSNTGGVTSGGTADALHVAMGRMSSLPISSSHGGAGGSAVGRNWTPGGGASSGSGHGGSAALFDIGLNGGASSVASLGVGTDKRPNFVAGQGMNLMGGGDRAKAASNTTVWEAPIAGGSSSSLRKNSFGNFPDDDEDDVPSPYRSIGQTPYDHGATRPGILRSSMASSNKKDGSGSSTSGGNGDEPQRRGSLGFDRTPSFGSIDGKSPPSSSHSPRGGSPTGQGSSSSGTGFGYNHQQPQQQTTTAGSSSTSHRTSRRVTIIVDP